MTTLTSSPSSGNSAPPRHTSSSSTTPRASLPPHPPFAPPPTTSSTPFSPDEDATLLRMLAINCPPQVYPKSQTFAWCCADYQVSEAHLRTDAEIGRRIDELLRAIEDRKVDLVVVPRGYENKEKQSQEGPVSNVAALNANANAFQPSVAKVAVNGIFEGQRSDYARAAKQDLKEEGEIIDVPVPPQARAPQPHEQPKGQPHHYVHPQLHRGHDSQQNGSGASPTSQQYAPQQHQQHHYFQQPLHDHVGFGYQHHTLPAFCGLHEQQQQQQQHSASPSSSLWLRGDFERAQIEITPQGRVNSVYFRGSGSIHIPL